MNLGCDPSQAEHELQLALCESECLLSSREKNSTRADSVLTLRCGDQSDGGQPSHQCLAGDSLSSEWDDDAL